MFRHVTSSCIFLLLLFEVYKYMLRPWNLVASWEIVWLPNSVYFFLSLIILHSKGFCSYHVLWQLNNNLYSTIKMNKNPDNINRYLSSLRCFTSLNEILQNHEKTSWFSLFQVAVDKTQKTRQFLLTKAAEGAKLPPICRFHIELTVSAPIPF